ncbi:MAG: HdeD family acid-resistance protein [Chitinivibrionales bacterium]|nr:HdeD family acid-resistance protein [Chitinivibrionales bacterium]MBD3358413.1 HdeD family acid-resistance protein [Chitinivibrionales bacterium]
MEGQNQSNIDIHSKVGAWSMTIGILMMILGIFTITFSVATTFITILTVGLVLAVRGLFEGIYALFTMRQEWFWRRLLGGILSLVIGVLLLSRPQLTAAAFTLFIAGFLIAYGLFRAIAAPVTHAPQWGWELISGILSLALGVWVWTGWPTSALWFIGLLVGVEILAQGMVLTAIPFALSKGRPSGAEPTAFAR